MAEQDKATWVKLVADFESGESTQRDFASERGISFSNLRKWLYKLRKGPGRLPPKWPGAQIKSPEQAPQR